MEQLIVTGANGLIGSAFCQAIQSNYQIIPFELSHPENPVDITDRENVFNSVGKTSAKHIIHFAAFTNVTAAWEQTNDLKGPAYQVNVIGTQNLVDAANEFDKHIICVSTAYVFDGEKKEQYTESDPTNPIEWYGKTKALAEEYAQEHAKNWTIFRIDQPFRKDPFAKQDLAHKIATDIETGSLQPQFTDHYFGPTWIVDFIKTIEWSIKTGAQGLYHASSGETWNNFDFAREIAMILGKPEAVTASSLIDYLKTNNRPYQKNTALNCQKLFSKLDFSYTPIKETLNQVTFNH